MKTLSVKDWRSKAEKLFGKDMKQWRFKCVSCGNIQTIQDFIDADIDAPVCKAHFSCIGRWKKGVGCDWTLGGLLQIHEQEVVDEDGDIIKTFEFDE